MEKIENLSTKVDSELEITGLFCYPLKSGYPIKENSLTIDNSGPLYDRSFSLVEKTKMKILSMKEDPKLFYVKCSRLEDTESVKFSFEIPKNNKLLSMKDMENQEYVKEIIDLSKDLGSDTEIVVCGTKRIGKIIDKENINKAILDYFGKEYLLVYCNEAGKLSNYTFAKPEFLKDYNSEVAYMKYHDGAPLLIVQEEDLEELNTKIQTNNKESQKCSSLNFRPNIVIKGGEAQLVEKAERLIINNCVFRRVFNCGRCKLTTFDYNLGEFDKKKEPLDSLSEYKFDDIRLTSTFGGYYYLESDLNEKNNLKPCTTLKVGNKVKVE